MSKLRICIVAILLSASLVCTVLALTKEQAQSKCNDRYISVFNDCCTKHPDWCNGKPGETNACGQAASNTYDGCMRNYGYRGTNLPPKLPPPGPAKGPENPPSKKPPGPTPGPNKPPENPPSNRPPRPSPGGVSSGPTATPTPSTIYSKPKPSPSPSPKKDHHKG
jgi:hypothetical protein